MDSRTAFFCSPGTPFIASSSFATHSAGYGDHNQRGYSMTHCPPPASIGGGTYDAHLASTLDSSSAAWPSSSTVTWNANMPTMPMVMSSTPAMPHTGYAAGGANGGGAGGACYGTCSSAASMTHTHSPPATPVPRPKLTTSVWEDENTFCYQVDARNICVARRHDNDMVNGTKLLNVVGMSRGKRDGILKNEKGRVVIKVGAMHLKGVWITFERAKDLANKFKISDLLFPLLTSSPDQYLSTSSGGEPISPVANLDNMSLTKASMPSTPSTPFFKQDGPAYTMSLPSSWNHPHLPASSLCHDSFMFRHAPGHCPTPSAVHPMLSIATLGNPHGGCNAHTNSLHYRTRDRAFATPPPTYSGASPSVSPSQALSHTDYSYHELDSFAAQKPSLLACHSPVDKTSQLLSRDSTTHLPTSPPPDHDSQLQQQHRMVANSLAQTPVSFMSSVDCQTQTAIHHTNSMQPTTTTNNNNSIIMVDDLLPSTAQTSVSPAASPALLDTLNDPQEGTSVQATSTGRKRSADDCSPPVDEQLQFTNRSRRGKRAKHS